MNISTNYLSNNITDYNLTQQPVDAKARELMQWLSNNTTAAISPVIHTLLTDHQDELVNAFLASKNILVSLDSLSKLIKHPESVDAMNLKSLVLHLTEDGKSLLTYVSIIAKTVNDPELTATINDLSSKFDLDLTHSSIDETIVSTSIIVDKLSSLINSASNSLIQLFNLTPEHIEHLLVEHDINGIDFNILKNLPSQALLFGSLKLMKNSLDGVKNDLNIVIATKDDSLITQMIDIVTSAKNIISNLAIDETTVDPLVTKHPLFKEMQQKSNTMVNNLDQINSAISQPSESIPAAMQAIVPRLISDVYSLAEVFVAIYSTREITKALIATFDAQIKMSAQTSNAKLANSMDLQKQINELIKRIAAMKRAAEKASGWSGLAGGLVELSIGTAMFLKGFATSDFMGMGMGVYMIGDGACRASANAAYLSGVHTKTVEAFRNYGVLGLMKIAFNLSNKQMNYMMFAVSMAMLIVSTVEFATVGSIAMLFMFANTATTVMGMTAQLMQGLNQGSNAFENDVQGSEGGLIYWGLNNKTYSLTKELAKLITKSLENNSQYSKEDDMIMGEVFAMVINMIAMLLVGAGGGLIKNVMPAKLGLSPQKSTNTDPNIKSQENEQYQKEFDEKNINRFATLFGVKNKSVLNFIKKCKGINDSLSIIQSMQQTNTGIQKGIQLISRSAIESAQASNTADQSRTRAALDFLQQLLTQLQSTTDTVNNLLNQDSQNFQAQLKVVSEMLAVHHEATAHGG